VPYAGGEALVLNEDMGCNMRAAVVDSRVLLEMSHSYVILLSAGADWLENFEVNTPQSNKRRFDFYILGVPRAVVPTGTRGASTLACSCQGANV
jgi:hypothetical protein